MTFQNIKPNDRVVYRNQHGQPFTGRAQALLLFADHVVVDAGNGRPQVVNESNFVCIKRR